MNSIERALENDFERKGQIFKHLKNNHHHLLRKYMCTNIIFSVHKQYFHLPLISRIFLFEGFARQYFK